MSSAWTESGHGIYYYREYYKEEQNGGDNWTYIDPKTLRIISYYPEDGESNEPRREGIVVAGPFPSLEAAKAAYLVIYGGDTHER